MTQALSQPVAIDPAHDGRPQIDSGSFRDPSGFVFRRGGTLYRQVNRSCRDDFDQLISSGLYRRLVGEGLLIPHHDWHQSPADVSPRPDCAYRIIRPEPIPLVTYPFEWCFSHLQDAALVTLAIQRRALSQGMSLKDASALNIQFVNGRHVLIDTLSFEAYPQGRPWIAYGQFCQHFLAPLALMAYGDVRLGDLLRIHLDGVPLDLASRLLPRRTVFSPRMGLHLHTHAWLQRKLRDADQTKKRTLRRTFSRRSMELLLDSLEAAVRSLRPRKQHSAWSTYYPLMRHYPAEASGAKQRFVDRAILGLKPGTVWDLGANTGTYSRLAARHAALVASWDMDRDCVERNYRTVKGSNERSIVPLVLDLKNPSPALGWAHAERKSFAQRGPADVVLALGLIHHLAIGTNVPLDRIASFMARIGRSLIVEFVPKDDVQVRRMLATRRDIFDQYSRDCFEKEFARRFTIEGVFAIPGTCRTLYRMRGRNP